MLLQRGYFIYITSLVCYNFGVYCLELTELIIPSHANLGQSVTLTCTFNLYKARLYSVKWYKDEFAFFSYTPGLLPQMQVFPIQGIILDESKSDMNHVSLREISFSSSGNYRCEVSTEAPNFATVFRSSNLTVLAYPEGGPYITGLQSHYIPGDYIIANCTAAPSNPAPELDWYINGAKADTWLVERKPEVMTSRKEPLYAKSLGLRFQVDKRYFRGPDSTLHLRCTSRVADLPERHKDFTTQLGGKLTNQKLAQERLPSKGSLQQRSQLFYIWLAIICCRELISS